MIGSPVEETVAVDECARRAEGASPGSALSELIEHVLDKKGMARTIECENFRDKSFTI